jgi:hypothetical protein
MERQIQTAVMHLNQAGFNIMKTSNNQGFNAKTPIWYYMGEPVPVRRITPAHDFSQIKHKGWFCDEECNDVAFGIVGSLSHGRFIAGYQLSMNDEKVFFDGLFTDEHDAALMADEYARVIAEQEMEHSQKWNAANSLETKIDDSFSRLRECLVLRHVACMAYVRDEITGLIETIRESRETLATEFKGVL